MAHVTSINNIIMHHLNIHAIDLLRLTQLYRLLIFMRIYVSECMKVAVGGAYTKSHTQAHKIHLHK